MLFAQLLTIFFTSFTACPVKRFMRKKLFDLFIKLTFHNKEEKKNKGKILINMSRSIFCLVQTKDPLYVLNGITD